MNTMGDDDEDLALLAQGLPMSAPVAADMGQSRTSHPYVPRSAAPASRWGAHEATDDLPAGHPYGGGSPYTSAPPPAPSPASVPAAAHPAPAPAAPAATPAATVPVHEPAHAVEDGHGHPAHAVKDGHGHPAHAAEDGHGHAAKDESAHAARDGHAAAVGRSGHEQAPGTPPHGDYPFSGGTSSDPPDDPNRVILRKQLDALRVRAANATSWQEASQHYTQLINSDGVVPVTARFTRDDIEFLGRAREEMLGLAELGLRLLELHAPLDAGGISTDPSSPILRCRSCMWRWPCPTFSLLSETVSQLPHPGSPLSR